MQDRSRRHKMATQSKADLNSFDWLKNPSVAFMCKRGSDTESQKKSYVRTVLIAIAIFDLTNLSFSVPLSPTFSQNPGGVRGISSSLTDRSGDNAFPHSMHCLITVSFAISNLLSL